MPFVDVGPGDWFYQFVAYLYCRGVVSGYDTNPPCGSGTPCFSPYNTTTRGQVAKIVVAAFNFPIDTSGGPHFSDVPPGSPFYDYIETARNLDLVTGYADGTFRPNNDVTRAQTTKITVLGAIVADPARWTLIEPVENTFADVPFGSPFYRHIETAVAHNVLAGYSCGAPPAGQCGPGNKPYFLPGNTATRAQISKIVYRAVTFTLSE